MLKNYRRYRKHLIKLLSLLLAVFVWVYVLNSERLKFEKIVKLEYRLKDQVVFAIKPLQEVTFVLEGPRAFMRNLLEREDSILIDISYKNPQFKRGQYTLKESDLSLPYGVKVDRIIPRRLNLQLDKKIAKDLPVKFSIEGPLPDPLFFKEVVVDPVFVKAEGARAIMSLINEIKTKPVQSNLLIEERVINLETFNHDSRILYYHSKNYTLYANIAANKFNRKISQVSARIIGEGKLVPNQKFELEVWVMEDKQKIWKKLVKEVQLVLRTPDKDPLKAKMQEVTPIVSLPRGVYLHKIKPETVLINVP